MDEYKPKILLIGGSGVLSGVPRHLRHLAQALHDVSDLTCIAEGTGNGYEIFKNTSVHFVPVNALRARLNPFLALRAALNLRRALHDTPADLVWVHARMPVILVRLLLALKLWNPEGQVAITYHGLPTDAGHRAILRLLAFWIEKTLLRAGPNIRIVLLTEEMKHRFAKSLKLEHIDQYNIHILPNCSDLALHPPATLHKDSNQIELVMTSRTCHQKNLPLALRLFNNLPSNYRLTMLGDGTDTPQFIRSAQRILSPDAFARLTLIGAVTDIEPFLTRADGFLLTSRYEGQPISVLEAMQMGLPLVLSRFEGVDGLIANHPSALVSDFEDLVCDAAKVDQFMSMHLADRNQRASKIKALWSRQWSPHVFKANCKNVVAAMLAHATD